MEFPIITGCTDEEVYFSDFSLDLDPDLNKSQPLFFEEHCPDVLLQYQPERRAFAGGDGSAARHGVAGGPDGPVRVLLMGISFMARLRRSLVSGELQQVARSVENVEPTLNLGLTEAEASVAWESHPGGYFEAFNQQLDGSLLEYSPGIVLFELGSNDLTLHYRGPEAMGQLMFELVDRALMWPGVRAVAILQVLHRTRSGIRHPKDHQPRMDPVEEFNQRVDCFNRLVERKCEERPDVIYFEFPRKISGSDSMRKSIGHDGVHLLPEKQLPYYKAIRGAVLQARRIYFGQDLLGKTHSRGSKKRGPRYGRRRRGAARLRGACGSSAY